MINLLKAVIRDDITEVHKLLECPIDYSISELECVALCAKSVEMLTYLHNCGIRNYTEILSFTKTPELVPYLLSNGASYDYALKYSNTTSVMQRIVECAELSYMHVYNKSYSIDIIEWIIYSKLCIVDSYDSCCKMRCLNGSRLNRSALLESYGPVEFIRAVLSGIYIEVAVNNISSIPKIELLLILGYKLNDILKSKHVDVIKYALNLHHSPSIDLYSIIYHEHCKYALLDKLLLPTFESIEILDKIPREHMRHYIEQAQYIIIDAMKKYANITILKKLEVYMDFNNYTGLLYSTLFYNIQQDVMRYCIDYIAKYNEELLFKIQITTMSTDVLDITLEYDKSRINEILHNNYHLNIIKHLDSLFTFQISDYNTCMYKNCQDNNIELIKYLISKGANDFDKTLCSLVRYKFTCHIIGSKVVYLLLLHSRDIGVFNTIQQRKLLNNGYGILLNLEPKLLSTTHAIPYIEYRKKLIAEIPLCADIISIVVEYLPYEI